MKFMLTTALLALTLAAAPAIAATVKLGSLTIENPWARATPKGADVGAGYLTIKNDGATDDRLTEVSTTFSAAQVHEMKMNNGVMEMRPVVGGLLIPAHKSVALKPGGYHIMFTGLKHPLAKGQTAQATLSFAHAGKVSVAFPIMAVGSAGPAGMKPGMMDMKKM